MKRLRSGVWFFAVSFGVAVIHDGQLDGQEQRPPVRERPETTATCDWFAAPTVSAGGAGTLQAPWSIETAFSSQRIRPGQTLCLRGGTYRAGVRRPFKTVLNGTPDRPVKVRSFPGEHAVLDGSNISPTFAYTPRQGPTNVFTLVVAGAHTWIMDVEITSSSVETRQETVMDGRGPTLSRGRGLAMTGRGSKLINSLVHNTGSSGIFISGNPPVDAPGAEVYGCLFWDNGWQYPEKMRGRGGGHAFYLDGNDDPTAPKRIADTFIGANFGDFGLQIVGGPNGFVIENNIIARRSLVGSNASNVVFRNNMWWRAGLGGLSPGVALEENVGLGPRGEFRMPPDQVIVKPNAYDPNRAHIVIYNDAESSTVRADLSTLGWPANSAYELHTMFDFKNDIVAGKLSGSMLEVVMSPEKHTMPVPHGWTASLMPNPFPKFGAFVILRK